MGRYIKASVILILVVSLLSGCELKDMFWTTNYDIVYDYEWGTDELVYDYAEAYMDITEFKDGKISGFSNLGSSVSFDLVEEGYLIPYIMTVKNGYLYYGVFGRDINGILGGFSIWRQEMFGDYSSEKLIELESEYRLNQMAVDNEGNVFIIYKDVGAGAIKLCTETYPDGSEREVYEDRDLWGDYYSEIYYMSKYDKDGNRLWNNNITEDIKAGGGGHTHDYNMLYRITCLDVPDDSFLGQIKAIRYSKYDMKTLYCDDNAYLYAANAKSISIFDGADGKMKYEYRYGGKKSEDTYGLNSITGIIEDRQGIKYITSCMAETNQFNFVVGDGLNNVCLKFLEEIGNKGANRFNAFSLSSETRVYINRNAASKGLNYDLLLTDGSTLCGLDIEKRQIKKLFNFYNEGINRQNVVYTAELPDGKIFVAELVTPEKVRGVIITPGVGDGREIISIFAKYYNEDAVKEIIEFNKNNTEYRAVIYDESDIVNFESNDNYDIEMNYDGLNRRLNEVISERVDKNE